MPDQPVPEFVRTMTNVPLFIGMIANSWAKLEHAMIPLANRLLRTADDKVGRIVMISLAPPAKRDLLLALTEISPLSDQMRADIASFCKEFERLRVLRNDIVHGRWDSLTKEGKPILHTSSARSTLKETLTEAEVEWLISVRNEIESLTTEAFAQANALTGLWPSTGTPTPLRLSPRNPTPRPASKRGKR